MATPTVKSFGNFLVKVGNAASPEVFSAPCGFTEKALQLSADTVDTTLPDCDDPDAPSWVARDVTRLAAQVTGSGVMATESVATWRAWYLSGNPKNVRVEIAGASSAGGGYYAGAFLLTSMELGAKIGEKVTCNVTLVSDGPVTWTAAS